MHKLGQMESLALLVEMGELLIFLRGSGHGGRALVGTDPNEHSIPSGVSCLVVVRNRYI